MNDPVRLWWYFLWGAALLNGGLWGLSAYFLSQRHPHFFYGRAFRLRRRLLWLSAVYVGGCAFRSVLPRIDLERICLAPTVLSNMLIGRSVATVAELCFIAQCAILLYQAGQGASRPVVGVSRLLLPLIVVAECASWYAVLSTNYLGHVVENSIWTGAGALLLVCFFLLWPHADRMQRRFLAAMMLVCAGYIAFMTGIDVPMYWGRWQAELARQASNLPLMAGVLDAAQPCRVDFGWAVWREEIPWMTLYFTVAVWVSIALAHAPGWINGLAHPPAARAEG